MFLAIVNDKNLNNILNLIMWLLIIFAISANIYSLSQGKAFWLDEWAILYNIKFKTYSELFGDLYYIQQFPRVYLCIIKAVAEFSNYNYFFLRLIPTTIQVVNIFFIALIIKNIVFPYNINKRILFVLFFLSFQITIFYFSQIKQYTCEMFLSLTMVYYFNYFSFHYNTLKIKSFKYILFLFIVFVGSFFSYSFVIVIFPLFLCFLATSVIIKKIELKIFLPVFVFMCSFLINYFTDLQYVFSNKAQYQNFNSSIMNYENFNSIINSLYNIIRVFAYNITYNPINYNIFIASALHFMKVIIIMLTSIGFFLLLKKHVLILVKEKTNYIKVISFTNKPDISLFFLILFLINLVLFFSKLVPIGQARLNYFAYLYTTYFLISGLYLFANMNNILKYIIIICVVLTPLFQIIRNYTREIENKNLIFDQQIYNNVGNAILTAQTKKLPIVVAKNEFYPSSIMENIDSLIIKAHHLYKPNNELIIYMTDSLMVTHLTDSLSANYIKLNKHNYQIY